MSLKCGSTTWFHGTVAVALPMHAGAGAPGVMDHAKKVAEARALEMARAYVRLIARCPGGCGPARSQASDLICSAPMQQKTSSGIVILMEYRFPVSCPPHGEGGPEESTADGHGHEEIPVWPYHDPMPVEGDVTPPPAHAEDALELPGSAIPGGGRKVCRSSRADSARMTRDYTSEFKRVLQVTRYLGPQLKVISEILKELADAGVINVQFAVAQEWRADWRHICPPALPASVISAYIDRKTALAEAHCRTESGIPTCYHIHQNFAASLNTVASEARSVIEEAVQSIWDPIENALRNKLDTDNIDPPFSTAALDQAWTRLRASFGDVHALHRWEDVAPPSPHTTDQPLLYRYYVQPVNTSIGVAPEYYLETAFIGLERNLDLFDIEDLKARLRQYVLAKIKSIVKKELKRILGLGN